MKPKVICHIMASVDGHLQVERWSAPLHERDRAELMAVYPEIARQLYADAWTFGRNTLTDIFPDKTDIFNTKGKPTPPDEVPTMETNIYSAPRKSKRLFLSFDPEADILYTASQLRGDDILCILPMQKATSKYLKFLHGMSISYLVVDDFSDMRNTLELINKHFNVKTISLQGGGLLNGGMLNCELIDELSLVVYPGLDCQRDSVGLFDGVDPQIIAHTHLQLLSVQPKTNGAVWLRYRIHQAHPQQGDKRTSPHVIA